MKIPIMAGAVLATSLMLAGGARAQVTTDANKQPTQSMAHDAPAGQPSQSLSREAPTRQQAQSLGHEAPPKQPAQSLSHGDSGTADGVTKQH